MAKKIRAVMKLLNPEMCLECRFNRGSAVADYSGKQSVVVNCTRGDCDNWIYNSKIEVDNVRPLE